VGDAARGVAVVTGAGSGIGRAVAGALLGAGWRVALAGRRTEPLEETAEAQGLGVARRAGERTASGGRPANAAGVAGDPRPWIVVPTDVADPASVARLFGAVDEAWGRVDLLVNNAGTFGPVGEVDEIAVDGWLATVGVNLTGAFLCARAAVAAMKAQDPRGGRIINNGSISAHTPRPGSAAYTATKHAMTGLTKSLSLDGRAHGIACGQIDIGNAATPMTAGIARGARQADGRVVAEPTFDVRHAADAVLFMAGLPLDTNVQFLTVTATAMPFIGRG
jgi:NAD(P)-dependent dehydrogenase (short-subunit alcohol dehydrogenase family)